MNAIKRNFGNIAMILTELIIGILLLVDPIGFTSGIIVAFGIILMVMGVANIIKYFRTEAVEAAVSQLLSKGIVQLLGGLFCTFCSNWFIATFPVLTLIYGVVILVAGITKIQRTVDIIRLKYKRWFLVGISAAISILCGVVIITSPFSTTAVLWTFTGISLIVEAVFDVIGALFGGRDKKEEAAVIDEEN